jgi:hypothetical protein
MGKGKRGKGEGVGIGKEIDRLVVIILTWVQSAEMRFREGWTINDKHN